jgi:EmrB/QacA subfamily drug resistance transporter
MWLTLAAVSVGLFMIMLDNTVVNVALPAIQRDLEATLPELQWVVTGYALAFAAFMLIGGKVADAYGRRRIFVLGILVFTGASLLCGLAGSSEALIAARVVQGLGAALMSPATLSIIAATFPPARRGVAVGVWAGVSALALAIGPLVGGLLTEHLSWHWIFFVNVPVGVAGVLASYLLVPESRDETHERLDLPGLATSGLGLFALTYGLIEANTYGWTSTRILGSSRSPPSRSPPSSSSSASNGRRCSHSISSGTGRTRGRTRSRSSPRSRCSGCSSSCPYTCRGSSATRR